MISSLEIDRNESKILFPCDLGTCPSGNSLLSILSLQGEFLSTKHHNLPSSTSSYILYISLDLLL